MSFTEKAALWCFVFALIGAHMYAIDKKIGIKIHAKWRKWTSPHGEPKGSPERGFIYNRSNKVRWFWASVIASINFFVMIGWRHEDPRIELVNFFLITPATMAGFLIGPVYLRFKQKREELFATLDEVESGKINVNQRVKKAASERLGALDKIIDRCVFFFANLLPSRKKAPSGPTPSQPASAPVDPSAEEEAARERLRQFTKGGR